MLFQAKAGGGWPLARQPSNIPLTGMERDSTKDGEKSWRERCGREKNGLVLLQFLEACTGRYVCRVQEALSQHGFGLTERGRLGSMSERASERERQIEVDHSECKHCLYLPPPEQQKCCISSVALPGQDFTSYDSTPACYCTASLNSALRKDPSSPARRGQLAKRVWSSETLSIGKIN